MNYQAEINAYIGRTPGKKLIIVGGVHTTPNPRDFQEMVGKCLPKSNIIKWKQFDDPDAINVMILGTGPVGLYTALYLHHMYNKDTENMTEFSFRKVKYIHYNHELRNDLKA